jgi:hypothetical protein
MPTINLHLVADDCWPDLAVKTVIRPEEPIEMALLQGGMVSGASAVAIRLNLPDGRVVVTETSLALLVTCVRAMVARTEAFP